MLSAKRKAVTAGKTPVHVFKVEKTTRSTRKRARFGPEKRQEVKAVGQNRACLRCSLLKVKCTNDAICTTCSSLILHTNDKQTLSFSGCIRTRLVEVSSFEAYIPQPGLRDPILAKAGDLTSTTISLQFASEVTWMNILVNDFVTWLCNPMDSNTSKVGTLSSHKFLELISPSIKDREKTNFQRMIYAGSLAYTQVTAIEKHYLSIPELRQISAIAGHELLKFLDDKLKPQSLKGCSYGDIQALFLLVFGTILALSYAAPSPDDLELLNDEVKGSFVNVHHLAARHYHLCQILAHYLVYLGSQLKLPLPSDADQFLLETAPERWRKRGMFYWSDAIKNDFDIAEDEYFETSYFKVVSCGPTLKSCGSKLLDSVPCPNGFPNIGGPSSNEPLNLDWAENLSISSTSGDRALVRPFDTLSSDQLPTSKRALTQDEMSPKYHVSQNEGFDITTLLPSNDWNWVYQPALDILPDFARTDMVTVADLRRRSGVEEVTQNPLQSISSTLPTLGRREPCQPPRQPCHSACSTSRKLKLYKTSCPLSTKFNPNLSCVDSTRPIIPEALGDMRFLQSPQLHSHRFDEIGTYPFLNTDAEPVNSRVVETKVNDPQKKLLDRKTRNLLV